MVGGKRVSRNKRKISKRKISKRRISSKRRSMRGGSHSSNKKSNNMYRKNQKDITTITDIDIYNNIYTKKKPDDPNASPQYLKVTEIKLGYHPSVYTENSPEWKQTLIDNFGINIWITKVQEVTKEGLLIGNRFPMPRTVNNFLSEHKVWKNLHPNP